MAIRVYFAFDYKDVGDFRANVVRNHNALQGVEKAGFYDASIWEEAEKTGPMALKRMINKELDYTSVTAVLIGADTWARRWVRYEIMKSIERGNSLIGIHINSIAGKDQITKPLGPNPFDNLGLEVSEDGKRVRPTEWKDQKWVMYSDIDPFTVPEQPLANRNKHLRLSHWFPVYDWVADSGYLNFKRWVGSSS